MHEPFKQSPVAKCTRRALFGGAIAGAVVMTPGCSFVNRFGEIPEGKLAESIHTSPNWIDGEFRNQQPTSVMIGKDGFVEAWWKFLTNSTPDLKPAAPLPCTHTDLSALDPSRDIAVWLGHSGLYFQLAGLRFLVDPVYSAYASPVSFINKSFEFRSGYPFTAKTTPPIDLLILTHDHWDHLDCETIKALDHKVKRYAVPLGVNSHLLAWGINPDKILVFDWYDAARFTEPKPEVVHPFHKPEKRLQPAEWKSGALQAPAIYFFPSRHFSGRTLKRDQTLWGSYVIEAGGKRLYLSGDGGNGPHFKEIGDLFRDSGGFDLAFTEDGQYNADWAEIHMAPEGSVKAATEVGAKSVIPIHNCRYALARHAWYDPLERIRMASHLADWKLLTPKVGDVVPIGDLTIEFPAWWRDVPKSASS